MAGGKPGFVISVRPRRYKTTPQQLRFREALAHCEIQKGMSRRDLVDKMIHCIPEYYRQIKGQGQDAPAP